MACWSEQCERKIWKTRETRETPARVQPSLNSSAPGNTAAAGSRWSPHSTLCQRAWSSENPNKGRSHNHDWDVWFGDELHVGQWGTVPSAAVGASGGGPAVWRADPQRCGRGLRTRTTLRETLDEWDVSQAEVSRLTGIPSPHLTDMKKCRRRSHARAEVSDAWWTRRAVFCD